jgi:hypothetical protein
MRNARSKSSARQLNKPLRGLAGDVRFSKIEGLYTMPIVKPFRRVEFNHAVPRSVVQSVMTKRKPCCAAGSG